MRRLASLATAWRQSGQRKQYEPRSSSAHTRTVRSSAVSCTSPQLGQLARIVVTASPIPGPLEVPQRPPWWRLIHPSAGPRGRLRLTGLRPWSHLARVGTTRRGTMSGRGRHHLRPPWRPARSSPRTRFRRFAPPSTRVPRGIETDVWLSADGEVVCAHDPVVARGLRRRKISSTDRRGAGDARASRASPTSTTSSAPRSSARST